MKQGRAKFPFLLLVVLFAVATLASAQSSGPAAAASAHMIVTAEPHHGSSMPDIHRGDVMVYETNQRRPVESWAPFQGRNAGLQLYLLIDDALASRVQTQLEDLRGFISQQPATTEVGVAYMRNGSVQIAQKPTSDHAAVLKALRIPQGITGGSAWESLPALITKWPAGAPRREIVMFTPGIEPFYPAQIPNPAVDEAITAAQRAGIPVFTVYGPAAGHWGHTWWRITWAQTYLSQLADETGAEGYGLAGLYPVTFTPYFDSINRRLQRQYELTFDPLPGKTGMQPVRIITELPKLDLIAADKVFVPVGK